MHRLRTISLAVFVLMASVSLAQVADQEMLADWRRQLVEIRGDLFAGEWSQAETRADRLSDQLGAEVVGGDGASMLMGMVTTYRAIAEAGLGQVDAAIWHWQVAQQLFPEVQELDIGRFGGPTALLAGTEPRVLGEGGGARVGGAELVPPKKIHAPEPEFPTARRYRGALVDVVVQVVVGVDGIPREPVIIDAQGEPTLVQAGLEALRGWRFEPALQGGEPVAILYRLTVRFQVPDTAGK